MSNGAGIPVVVGDPCIPGNPWNAEASIVPGTIWNPDVPICLTQVVSVYLGTNTGIPFTVYGEIEDYIPVQ